ncbi:hypothetical protein NQZ68_026453 [Dissostichus eleginoides]|nr:hypothetical protein NQZ68_026453 [Dissostichus eleginoides]
MRSADVSDLCRDLTAYKSKEDRQQQSAIRPELGLEVWAMRTGPHFSGLRGSAALRPPSDTPPPPSSIINSNVPPLFICVWIATRALDHIGLQRRLLAPQLHNKLFLMR